MIKICQSMLSDARSSLEALKTGEILRVEGISTESGDDLLMYRVGSLLHVECPLGTLKAVIMAGAYENLEQVMDAVNKNEISRGPIVLPRIQFFGNPCIGIIFKVTGSLMFVLTPNGSILAFNKENGLFRHNISKVSDADLRGDSVKYRAELMYPADVIACLKQVGQYKRFYDPHIEECYAKPDAKFVQLAAQDGYDVFYPYAVEV